MRAALHSTLATLLGLLAAVMVDATLRFVRLGVTLGTAAWGCGLSAAVAATAALTAPWAVSATSVGKKDRATTIACTALWGLWLAVFCVRTRWGWVSLERVDGGSGPPGQLAMALLSLSGLTSSFFARYLSTGASRT